MAGILTPTEVAEVLKYDSPEECQDAVDMVPAVAEYLKTATGHDWESDDPIDPVAKMAARMLLVRWYEVPGMAEVRQVVDMTFGINHLVTQLQVKAEKLEASGGED